MTLTTIPILIGAYLIGALPSAYLAGRRRGVSLRELGDGNLGTRNTYRVLGLKPALYVGALDIGKGAFATWLATLLSDHPLVPYGAALCAVIGHDFSIYIRFVGGMSCWPRSSASWRGTPARSRSFCSSTSRPTCSMTFK